MPDDIFNTQDQGKDTTNALETLVGDGKKYGDNEALAKSRIEADTFIEQLKDEKKQLSDALEAEQKKTGQTQTIADLIKEVRGQNASDDKTNNQGLSEEDFQERVRTIVQGDSDASTKATNREQGNKLVLDKMKGSVEAAKSYIAERAAELGSTPAKLAELSESSPKAFAKLMDVTPSAAPKSTIGLPNNTDNFDNNAAALEIEGTHTKAYFDARKKELGVVKYVNDTALQLDYMRSAVKLGERF